MESPQGYLLMAERSCSYSVCVPWLSLVRPDSSHTTGASGTVRDSRGLGQALARAHLGPGWHFVNSGSSWMGKEEHAPLSGLDSWKDLALEVVKETNAGRGSLTAWALEQFVGRT